MRHWTDWWSSSIPTSYMTYLHSPTFKYHFIHVAGKLNHPHVHQQLKTTRATTNTPLSVRSNDLTPGHRTRTWGCVVPRPPTLLLTFLTQFEFTLEINFFFLVLFLVSTKWTQSHACIRETIGTDLTDGRTHVVDTVHGWNHRYNWTTGRIPGKVVV